MDAIVLFRCDALPPHDPQLSPPRISRPTSHGRTPPRRLDGLPTTLAGARANDTEFRTAERIDPQETPAEPPST
jgi:hypothetical protein